MTEMKQSIDERIQSMETIAELFYQQKSAQGMEALSVELPKLVTVIDQMYLYKQEHEDMPFEDAQISEALQQMLASMEDKDYVLLADVMKYEMIEKFQAISENME